MGCNQQDEHERSQLQGEAAAEKGAARSQVLAAQPAERSAVGDLLRGQAESALLVRREEAVRRVLATTLDARLVQYLWGAFSAWHNVRAARQASDAIREASRAEDKSVRLMEELCLRIVYFAWWGLRAAAKVSQAERRASRAEEETA